MLPISPRFAALTLVAVITMGCSTLASLAGDNHGAYGPLVNRSIPGNDLHVYRPPAPTTNMGRTLSMSIRAENRRIEKVADVLALGGVALGIVPLAATSSLFLCAASLAMDDRAEWWSTKSLEPSSLMASVTSRKYCFTENGRFAGLRSGQLH